MHAVNASRLSLLLLGLALGCSSEASNLAVSSNALTDGPAPVPVTDLSGTTPSDAGLGGTEGGKTLGSDSTAPLGEPNYQAPNIRAITSPENVTSLAHGGAPSGLIRTDFTATSPPVVLDRFSLSVRHHGGPCLPTPKPTCTESENAVANPIQWDVGTYTGFRPPAPVGAWQRGRLDLGAEIGASAMQLQGTTAGVLTNTWSFDHTSPVVGGGPNVVYAITYSSPASPFLHPTSALTLQAFVRLPWATSWKGGIGQLSFFFYLRDVTTGRDFAYVLAIWDSRSPGDGNGTEFVGHDTQVSFVSSPLRSGTKFSTLSPFSAAMRNTVTWTGADFFRVHVPATKLLDAVAAIEEKAPGATFSRRPSDYVLTHVGILQEVFVGTDPETNMSMGASFTDVSVYEFY